MMINFDNYNYYMTDNESVGRQLFGYLPSNTSNIKVAVRVRPMLPDEILRGLDSTKTNAIVNSNQI